MRRIRSGCCARATAGHATALPTSVMNSRRLIASPEPQDKASCRLKLAHLKEAGCVQAQVIERSTDVRFGS